MILEFESWVTLGWSKRVAFQQSGHETVTYSSSIPFTANSFVENVTCSFLAKRCQTRSMYGRDYVGSVNTTKDGTPCQRWSDREPHEHSFHHVGDHNFCRNPYEAPLDQVFCYTSDPSKRYQVCSVPICPPLKVLDFSLDNDMKPDAENEYTHASLALDLPLHLPSAHPSWWSLGLSSVLLMSFF